MGATVSLPKALFRAVGGTDLSLTLGEDTELGYRLTQTGAVFVPDTGALSWHLGTTTAMRRSQDVRRHNDPFIADRVPYRRYLRTDPGRQWLVPYVDVVVDTLGAAFEDVRASVDGALASTLPDLRVTVVGPWSSLTADRRAPLDDPLLDLRLIQGQYAHDSRVSFVEEVSPTASPTPFRLTCPAGWVPGAESLALLVEQMEKDDEGLLLVALEECESGVVAARLERTAAVARAIRVARDGESLDDVIADLYGATWLDAESWKFRPAARAYPAWASGRNREAVRWRAEAESRKREAERAQRQVATLKAELKELRASVAKSQRDTSRWREKAEQRRRRPWPCAGRRTGWRPGPCARCGNARSSAAPPAACGNWYGTPPSLPAAPALLGGRSSPVPAVTAGTPGEAGVTDAAAACTWPRPRRAWS
ncbi:glycosyltransferase family 2 protein [Streptosporangium lutulentum]